MSPLKQFFNSSEFTIEKYVGNDPERRDNKISFQYLKELIHQHFKNDKKMKRMDEDNIKYALVQENLRIGMAPNSENGRLENFVFGIRYTPGGRSTEKIFKEDSDAHKHLRELKCGKISISRNDIFPSL